MSHQEFYNFIKCNLFLIFNHFLLFLFFLKSDIVFQYLDNSLLIFRNIFWFSFKFWSYFIDSTGHSGIHIEQSIHSSGSITRKLFPSLKQFTGQTVTQSVNLHFMQFSITTCVMGVQKTKKSYSKKNKRFNNKYMKKNISLSIKKENFKIHLRHHIY